MHVCRSLINDSRTFLAVFRSPGDDARADDPLVFPPTSCQSGTALGCALETTGAASRLRVLKLQSNRLGDASAEALGRALAAQGPKGALRQLYLGGNQIGTAGVIRLADGLRRNSTLELFNLQNNAFGAEGAAAIAAAISGGGGDGGGSSVESGVKSVSLLYNRIDDDGVA